MTLRRICSMEEWKEYKLKDFLLIPIRNGLTKPSSIRGKGVKMIGMKEIFAMDYIRSVDMDRVPVTDKEYESSEILKYDLLFARQSLSLEGAGKCGIVVSVDEPTVFESHLIRLRIDTKKANPFFIYYYYKSSIGKNQIKSLVQQVAAAGIRGKELIELGLKVPHIEKQNQIANILRAIDNKIEVNRQINDNLEQQAQALFKSWFVDFEPFRDQPFVESELGMIPKGWRVIQLIDIAEISKNSINPQKQPQTIFNHYSIPAFDEGMKPEIQLGEEIKSNKFVITNKITLFSKLNPRIKRVWYVDNLNSNSICSTEFVPYKAKDESQSSFLYSLINSQGFYDFVMSMVNGATGSHQRFHPEESLNYRIAFSYECVSKYCEVMSPIIHQMLEKREESRCLAQLRDTLLPRLMSSELKINDI